jgi:peptide/nickel transport system permease protein
LLLTGTSLLLAWLLAIAFGIWSAAHRGKWSDRAGAMVTSSLLTVPDLVLFLALLLLAVRTGWFPTGGMMSAGSEDLGLGGKWKDLAVHLFLPCAGLVLATLPPLVRHVRSAMIAVLEAPFVRAARAHGIPERRVLLRYALPVAANPLITLFGYSIAGMLSASLLLEMVLSWPGVGPLLVDAILAKDVYVVVGAVMLSAVFLVAGNVVADALLFATDPRIRMD